MINSTSGPGLLFPKKFCASSVSGCTEKTCPTRPNKNSVSRTSQNMERSDSRTPEIKQKLQVGNNFVGIFGSLRLGNDDHPSINNSNVNAARGESSMNTMSRTLTTQTTSDQTQSFLNDSISQKTQGLQDFMSANSFGCENTGGSRVSGSKGSILLQWRSQPSRICLLYSLCHRLLAASLGIFRLPDVFQDRFYRGAYGRIFTKIKLVCYVYDFCCILFVVNI